MSNILLVATSSWAGMGPYASEIINSFYPDDNVRYFVVEDERHYFSDNINQKLRNNGVIVYRKNSSINKLCDLFYPSKKISKQILEYCYANNISSIHFLTSDFSYSETILILLNKYNVLFTVHDLHPHEAQKAFHKLLRQKIMHKKLNFIINTVDNLATNSLDQVEELKLTFPTKNIIYFAFPSLINQAIVNGSAIPPELENKDNYILFFGRIEEYKGIELVYKAFIESTALQNFTLVIAGSGDLYFQRSIDKEKNIIIINRYIHDNEVSYLFKHAIITVYPYISATQSGVLSLSCYYGKPIIASDVPFFKVVSEQGLGLNFQKGNLNDLIEKLIKLLSSDLTQIFECEKHFYEKNYSRNSLRAKLLSIYNPYINISLRKNNTVR